MILDWRCTTEPVSEPLTLAAAKQHARITHDTEDGLVLAYLMAARQAAEEYLGRGLLTQTWTATFDDFATELYLPMAAPLQNDPLASPSTAPVITYYDVNGTLQTLATSVYDVDVTSRPGKIALKAGQAWPALQSSRRAWRVSVAYVVGWTSAALVPERIKHGIRLSVAALDADRDGLAEEAARAQAAAFACWSDRVFWKDPVCS